MALYCSRGKQICFYPGGRIFSTFSAYIYIFFFFFFFGDTN